MGKLTDVECRNATCLPGINPDTGNPYGVRKLADGGGLFLWIKADGSKRWRYRYFVKGTNRDGKPDQQLEKLVSLGTYPTVTLAEARVAAAKAALIGDPAAARKATKQAKAVADSNSFEVLARRWHENHAPHWSKAHSTDVLKRLEAHVFPVLGKHPVTAIEAPDVLAAIMPVQDRGHLQLAYRVLSDITQVLDFAINNGLLRHNVAQGRAGALKPAPIQNHPHVKPHELPELLHSIADYKGNRRTQLAMQLLALTFVRVGELLGATWDEFQGATWEIPAERMKMRRAFLVPLAPQVQAILAELKELACGSSWVFPSRSHTEPMNGRTIIWALGQMGYAGKMTSHGFRHIASTALNEARNGDDMMFDGDAIEAQLAHRQPGVRGRYNKAQYLPERRRIMLWWADRLDELRR